jgi:hypothetical protein
MTTTVDESMRNGVDTATLFATLDARPQTSSTNSTASVPGCPG